MARVHVCCCKTYQLKALGPAYEYLSPVGLVFTGIGLFVRRGQ